MKIGFSFGRCIRDIVNGKVKIDDVLCIIARTYMPKEKDVEFVIEHYMLERNYLLGLDEAKCKEVGITLWRTGRVLEPRSNGVGAMSVPREYIWMDLFPTNVSAGNESVQAAWDHYRMLIGLTSQLPEGNEDLLRLGEKSQAYDHANRREPTPEELEEHRKAVELLANSI